VNETLAIDEWLWLTLNADAQLASLCTGGIHSEQAPQSALPPFIIFTMMEATDVRAASQQDRIMVSGLWLVRGIVQDTSFNATSQDIAERIDAALHAAPGGSVNDDKGQVFGSHREQPFRLAEDINGKQYRHLGGIYRIFAQDQE
jgi:hypothetical protein